MLRNIFISFVTLAAAHQTWPGHAAAAEPTEAGIVERAGLFTPLTEPPCSYCSTQHLTGLIRTDDRVVAWIRGPHNGGAVPLRHFLSGPRVINDTYGLFFYDPDGGYVAAYKKDYGFAFHGWRRGVMVVAGPDGTLWSALTGTAIAGPKTGQRLERIPSIVTDWGYWLMLHPESTAYNLFDGQTYKAVELPKQMSDEAQRSLAAADPRLDPMANVLGVEISGKAMAYALDDLGHRAAINDSFQEVSLCVFWHGPTRSAAAYQRQLPERPLTFSADAVPPESAPIEDTDTRTRWTMAGRAIDGPLRGAELTWVNSIQCRWYAWSAEHPDTELYNGK